MTPIKRLNVEKGKKFFYSFTVFAHAKKFMPSLLYLHLLT